jgi:hypothetical protein
MIYSNFFIVNVAQHNESCTVSSDCASNLDCISNICECSISTTFWNGTYCGILLISKFKNNHFLIFSNLNEKKTY